MSHRRLAAGVGTAGSRRVGFVAEWATVTGLLTLIRADLPPPPGVTLVDGGIEVSVYAGHADSVELSEPARLHDSRPGEPVVDGPVDQHRLDPG